MTPRRSRALLGALLLLFAIGCKPLYVERALDSFIDPVDPASTLIGCDQAGDALVLTATSHLDPSCVYTGGITISSSNVTLDCRGARLENLTGTVRIGVLITAPADEDRSAITVRNCFVKAFLNGMRVSRSGFKALPVGGEYVHGFSDVTIENSHVYATNGSGLYVDGFVTGVTIRGVEIQGAGSVGIYLEAGSKDNVIDSNVINNNGYKDTGPAGVPFSIGAQNYRYRSTGREGIAVDGSRNNRIVNNVIDNNAAGGIFLYKNCGEYHTQKPEQWWQRNYGADDNVIEGNTIRNGPVGVWVGSRMSQNPLLWNCSDPAYFTAPFKRIVLDYAARNTVRDNSFAYVRDGVRVEDDDTVVEGNDFTAHTPSYHAVLVGTMYRGVHAGHPVMNVVVQDNEASIDGNPTPYGTIPGADAATVTFVNNRSGGGGVAPVSVPQPPIDTFLIVAEFWPVP